jgi:hypothetical protein
MMFRLLLYNGLIRGLVTVIGLNSITMCLCLGELYSGQWVCTEYSNSYINIPNYQKSVENDIFVLY